MTNVTRRTVLKGLVASGVGAATGTSAYGYLYSRHQLEVTKETLQVVGLPPALSGLRIGLLTDRIRPKFEEMGVMDFENLATDGDIDWRELEKPLEYDQTA